MIDGSCDSCVWAVPTVTSDEDLIFKCRRYPPQVFALDGIHVTQTFPDAVNRCGEYKKQRR